MRRAWLPALLIAVLMPATASAATTTFKGRYVCQDRGVELPLANARVELWGGPQYAPGGGLVRDGYISARAAVAFTGPDGEWSFDVKLSTDPRYNFRPIVYFDDGQGIRLTGGEPETPIPFVGNTNQADRPLQDYGTLAVLSPQCMVWLGMRQAYAEYVQLMGKRPAYTDLVGTYDAPTNGYPFTEFTNLRWPKGYPADAEPGGFTAVRHEFAHTIRNYALGKDGFVSEVSGFPYRTRNDPCERTSRQVAFSEGWAEWWAGDFAPAPDCPGVAADSPDVEGMVAFRLSAIERGCAHVDRRTMVELMLRDGRQIHTINDFVQRIGTCVAVPFDPGSVPRVSISPSASRRAGIAAMRDLLRADRRLASKLGAQLTDARRAAEGVHCLRPPCPTQLTRKLAPGILAGALAQARLLTSILEDQLSPKGLRRLRSSPTLRTLTQELRAPSLLTRRLGAAGARGFGQALAAAGPIIRRDHSPVSAALVRAVRANRTAFVHARRSGSGLPFQPQLLGPNPYRARPVSRSYRLDFEGIPDGTLITTQEPGATFGSAGALGFPAPPPRHTCPDGPTASAGTAIAPDCPAYDTLRDSGLVAKLASPAQAVRVLVGTTEPGPGGFAADLEAYDAAGNRITANAALVGSTAQGQGAGPVAPVDLQSPYDPIAYIAMYLDASFPSGPRLVFDNLEYDVP